MVDNYRYETYIGPDEQQGDFERILRAFDGKNRFAVSLCKLPHPGWGGDFTASQLDVAKDTYIQAAGSAERMTIELRRKIDGKFKQFVIGRSPSSDHSAPPSVPIRIGENSASLYPNEVFESKSAAKAFYTYYSRGELLNNEYTFREIEV